MVNQESRQDDDLRESKEKGYELKDANIPRVVIFGLGLVLLVIITGVVISGVIYKNMVWFTGMTPPPPPQYQAAQDELPPVPRIEVQGQRDLRQFRAAEQSQLESYGWVNKDDEVVRIPIERAMEIAARDGIPRMPSAPEQPKGK